MSTFPVLNNRPIDQWKVTDLEEELYRRELPTEGLKDDLVKRLADALQGEMLDGGEGTVGGSTLAEDQKEDETSGSADASGYQALVEQNVDEGPTEVATKEESLVVSVTEAGKESAVAATDDSQEAVVATVEVSHKDSISVTEVSDAPLPLVDVVATDVISLSDAAATKGDDLESVPSHMTIVKEVYQHAEVHSEIIATDEISLSDAAATKGDNLESVPSHSTTVREVYQHAEVHGEIIAEKDPEDGTNKKMTVDNVPSDVTSTDVKLDATSAKDELSVDMVCEISEQEAVPSFPSPKVAITSHAHNLDADVVASALEHNVEELILEKSFSDDDPMYNRDQEDSQRTDGDCKPIQSGPKDQVSEVNPNLGSQIKCASVSHDNASTNEKNSIKDDLHADYSDLELETKQEMVKPSSSILSIVDDLQALDDDKELPHNEASLHGTESATNMDLDKKEDSPHGGFPEKLNLDRSSGDESMEEDVVETKHVDSNIKSDGLPVKTEASSECVVTKLTLLDTITEDSSVHTKEVIAEDKPATEKRKPEAQEIVANNEPIKRQRRWSMDSVKIPEHPATKPDSDAPKDVFQPALKRSFGRSGSTASGDSPKERIIPLPQKPATTSLKIDRFVRPFTLRAVQELLGKTGSVCSFWMDQIKTHCYVTYSSVEEAVATRNAVYGLQWPPNNGSSLVAEFADPQEVKLKLEPPPPPPPAPISPTAATTPKAAPVQQSKANQTIPPHSAGTSRGLLPTPPALTKLPPIVDNEPEREKLPPAPKKHKPSVTLDDLFRKTQAHPRIYYMPVSEEEVSARLASHGEGTRRR